MFRSWLITLVAGASIAPATLSSAADLPSRPSLAPTVAAPAAVEYGNIYFGIDGTTHGSWAPFAGVLYAPFGMHQSGIRISAFGLGGRYEYESGPIEVQGKFYGGDLLIGWSHVFGNGAITLAAGLTHQHHNLSPDDLINPVRGGETGLKIQGDVWVNPTPDTLVFALASYTPVFETYYTLGRYGYDFTKTGAFFIGPEVGVQGNERTDQVRFGVHMSGIRIGAGKLNISGGWLNQRAEGDGAYGTATLDFPF